MKKINLLILFLITIFLSSCSPNQFEEINLSKVSDSDLERISEKAVVCNEPYIRVGIECCLDENDNGICDKDEKVENLLEEEKDISKSETTSDSYDLDPEFEDVEEKDEDFKELKLEIEEKDDFLYFEWNDYNNKDNFEWYDLSQSNEDPTIEEKVISNSGLIRDIDENYYLWDSYTEPGIYYFWVDLKLKDGSEIRSNIIKYDVEELIDPNTGLFQKCKFLAIAYNDQAIYTKGAAYEFDTKDNCIDEFEDVISTQDGFECSDTIVRRELIYREDEEDDFETIKIDECPVEISDFDDKTIISIAEGETKTITIGSKDYEVYMDGVFTNGVEEIKINDISEDFVEIFAKTPIDKFHVQVLETLASARQGVGGYAQIVIGNYDFTLTSTDTNEICYHNGQYHTEKTSVLAIVTGNEFELKESYCKTDSILNKYSCMGVDDSIEETEVDCEYGCESGECLKITEVGCDKVELTSGLISLAEGENTLMNNETLFDVISIGDGMAEIEIAGSTKYIEMCKETSVDDLTILIHETVQSSREGVSGYVEFSYE